MNLNLKATIDSELKDLRITSKQKRDILNKAFQEHKIPLYRKHNFGHSAAIILGCLLLCASTVFAAQYIKNRMLINEEPLPNLDDINVVSLGKIDAAKDEYGDIYDHYKSYDTVCNTIGLNLLDSKFSENNPYQLVELMSDPKDYCFVKVENFIVGDTSDYQWISEENRFEYSHGEKFYSPITLDVEIITSQEQLENGFEKEYLGFYEFVESYISEQGYRVNILKDTSSADESISEKIAIFVADGIRYTLSGRTSYDMLKEVVDSMK